jgi:hypothetical protein
MKYLISLLCFATLSFLSCNNNSSLAQNLAQDDNNDYIGYKLNFDRKFTDQFPDSISSKISYRNVNTSVRKNSFGMFLFEYEMPVSFLDSLGNALDKTKMIAKYKSSDTCLLIVHRFETKYTAEKGIIPDITDSSLLDKKCYLNQYPVPNFIKYKGNNSTQCGLDSTFDIYVLEAKKGRYSEKFNLKPFSHMPPDWANGYSKGISISRQNHTVIYWSIIW